MAQPTELKAHAALVYTLAFHPDGQVLATAGFDGAAKLWDFPAGKELRTLAGHAGPVYGVAFAPDGRTLATCSEDTSIRLWTADDGKPGKVLQPAHAGIVDAVAFSPDGRVLASCGGDKAVKLWDVAAAKELKALGSYGGTAYGLSFAPDGKLLATAGADGLVKVWDVPGQKEVKALKGHEGAVSAVLFTPAGLASVGFDRTLRLWDAAAGTESKKFGLPDDPYGLALSPDGKQVAVAGYAGHLTVWVWEQSKAAFTYKHKSPAYCVRFAPDGRALVSGHDDGAVRVTPVG
jgi:WD40 repeat protein